MDPVDLDPKIYFSDFFSNLNDLIQEKMNL